MIASETAFLSTLDAETPNNDNSDNNIGLFNPNMKFLQRPIQFKLMVSTSNSIKTVELNEPFFDVILPLSMKYYEVHVDPL